MRSLFICWRPIQIINAINFVINNVENTKINSDIIITSDFSGSEEIYFRLKEYDIFSNVIYAKEVKDKSLFRKFTPFFFERKYIKSRLGDNCEIKYDKIFASGWNELVFIFDSLNKHKAKVIFFEDGLGSYLGDAREYEFSKKLKVFGRLLKKGPFSVRVDSQYLSHPALCQFKKFSYPIKEVRLDMKNIAFLEILNKIFEYSGKGSNDSKIIILDQPIEGFIEPDKAYKKNELYQMVAEGLNKKAVTFRLHPNNDQNKFQNNNNVAIDKDNLSWELYSSNSICNEDTLFSFHSTALIVPKLLYNIEPNVICLYNLVPFLKHDEIHEIDVFFQKFKGIYNDVNKVMIPKTIDELEQILDALNTD